ncbi:DUF2534 family protein [Pantoea sp. 1.19]|uniref:DUF2534 family protein n=1 Tax=Pantoea sp. 1.19 TaxID=1925589 RepID=UPI000948A88D|nr:DUF2534 family protein [Pantoea sp. 1.19]
MLAKLKTRSGKKFMLAVLAVFIVMAVIMTRAMIGGVIEQYNIPLSQWDTEMYMMQAFMISIYSLVFTVLLSVPLGYWFLGGSDAK